MALFSQRTLLDNEANLYLQCQAIRMSATPVRYEWRNINESITCFGQAPGPLLSY